MITNARNAGLSFFELEKSFEEACLKGLDIPILCYSCLFSFYYRKKYRCSYYKKIDKQKYNELQTYLMCKHYKNIKSIFPNAKNHLPK